MRRHVISKQLLVLTILSSLVLFSSIIGQRSEKGAPLDNKLPYVPGELLVKFKDGAESNFARSVNSIIGTTAVETLGDSNWQRVKLPEGMSVESAISGYSLRSGVEYSQPNFYYHLLATPNDPEYLSNITTSMYGLGKISAPAAWDLHTGSSTVVVADIDTGLRYTHEDLAANAWVNLGEVPNNGIDDDNDQIIDDVFGADFRDNDGDPMDDNGHGTHTAGTIGGVGNNLLGVTGINWNVKIMAVKIYSGAGTDTTSAMLINAYNYVGMMKNRGVNIRVTNNSYGGCDEACGYDQATKDAIDKLGDAGILNVFAAGNSGTNNDVTPHYPSNYTSPSIVAVGASDIDDTRFYNYGPISVDLGAPGVGILSTTSSSDNAYGLMSGTSMATPHVTGAVALLASYRPDLSVASLKASILNNVDLIPAWSTLVKTGGRLNVFKAMQNPTVCTFNNGATRIQSRAAGGTYTINIPAATNCDYFVKSNNAWVTRNTAEVMSGANTVSITVGSNTGLPRTGTVTIGGQIYTIVQSGSRQKGSK